MPQFTMMGVASLLFGRMARHVSLKKLMVTGYTLIGVSLCAMSLFAVETSDIFIGITLAVLGLGAGLSVPATGMMVMDYAPAERAGIASATMNALRQIGMTQGIAILGSLMSLYAIQDMAKSVDADSIEAAVEIAHRAVMSYEFPQGREALILVYQSSMAAGFGLVMLCAGLFSLLAALLLVIFTDDSQAAHEAASCTFWKSHDDSCSFHRR
ncbi:MFS transporter [Photobacterium sp. GJ3]|uniref:MFS transporter n=1 Tax=Photobacterium sp. GJ3 TaxID=2829502 RepID=UPI001B8CB952|nr:MFS transporter [Photobacterium sp. GJ3]QUJ66625.1 MFS transporter [Photobacterium sp. GJ3]